MALRKGRKRRHLVSHVLKPLHLCLLLILAMSKNAAFIIPSVSRPHYSSRQVLPPSDKNKDVAKPEEVDRYRNRAALTEHVLKEKVQEMKLLQSKLDVLQDVVKKMNNTQTQQAQQQQDAMNATQEERLVSKWRQEKAKRIEATLQIEKLQSELNEAKSRLDRQATQQLTTIQDLRAQHDNDRSEWKEQTLALRQEKQDLQDKVRALRTEVLNIDQSLEMTQGQLVSVEKKLESRQDELRNLSQQYERQRRTLEEELETALAQQSALQRMLEERQTASEEERRESVEIASAAVRAAETREANLQQECTVLQEKLTEVEARYQQEIVSADSRQKETIHGLLQELEMERKKNDQRRMRDRQEFEKKLAAQRETYEAELRLFRTKGDDTVGTLKNEKDESPLNVTALDTVATCAPENSSEQALRRGLGRRLRSWLFSRRKR